MLVLFDPDTTEIRNVMPPHSCFSQSWKQAPHCGDQTAAMWLDRTWNNKLSFWTKQFTEDWLIMGVGRALPQKGTRDWLTSASVLRIRNIKGRMRKKNHTTYWSWRRKKNQFQWKRINCSKRQQHWGLGAMEWDRSCLLIWCGLRRYGLRFSWKIWSFPTPTPTPRTYGLMKDTVLPWKKPGLLKDAT